MISKKEELKNFEKEVGKEKFEAFIRLLDNIYSEEFIVDPIDNMAIALIKHPVYAEGKYQALGVVQSEIAEFLKAIERGTDEEAVAEAKDAVVTLQRFILGHHLPKGQQGYGWEKRVSD